MFEKIQFNEDSIETPTGHTVHKGRVGWAICGPNYSEFPDQSRDDNEYDGSTRGGRYLKQTRKPQAVTGGKLVDFKFKYHHNITGILFNGPMKENGWRNDKEII